MGTTRYSGSGPSLISTRELEILRIIGPGMRTNEHRPIDVTFLAQELNLSEESVRRSLTRMGPNQKCVLEFSGKEGYRLLNAWVKCPQEVDGKTQLVEFEVQKLERLAVDQDAPEVPLESEEVSVPLVSLTQEEILPAVGPLSRLQGIYPEGEVSALRQLYQEYGYDAKLVYVADPCGYYPLPIVRANLQALYGGRGVTAEVAESAIAELVKSGGLSLSVMRIKGLKSLDIVSVPGQAVPGRSTSEAVFPRMCLLWHLLPDDGTFAKPDYGAIASKLTDVKHLHLVRAVQEGYSSGVFLKGEDGTVARGNDEVALYQPGSYIGGKIERIREHTLEVLGVSARIFDSPALEVVQPADTSGLDATSVLSYLASRLEQCRQAQEEYRQTVSRIAEAKQIIQVSAEEIGMTDRYRESLEKLDRAISETQDPCLEGLDELAASLEKWKVFLAHS